MKLKRAKELTGEPLYWNDYLSLPFTQKVYIYSPCPSYMLIK